MAPESPCKRVMAVLWLRYFVPSLLSLLLPAACVNATGQSQQSASERSVLVGDFLIASPETVDPVFRHTVILVFHHDSNGTLGIIINQPVEVRSLASLVKAIGEDATGIEGKARIFAGGPMEPDIGFVLHSTDYRSAGTVDIDAQIAITTRPQIFLDIGHHRGPGKFLVAFGYAGWGPGQLEDELASNNWLTGTEDPTLVFDDDPSRIWQDALARRGREI